MSLREDGRALCLVRYRGGNFPGPWKAAHVWATPDELTAIRADMELVDYEVEATYGVEEGSHPEAIFTWQPFRPIL